MQRGLTARVIDQTRTMSDVYVNFLRFSSMLKSKVHENDPNAALTHKRIEAIQKACTSSGILSKRDCDISKRQHQNNSIMIMVIVLLLFIFFAVLFRM